MMILSPIAVMQPLKLLPQNSEHNSHSDARQSIFDVAAPAEISFAARIVYMKDGKLVNVPEL